MAKAVISDMDGVIYRGGQLIEGAAQFVANLQQNRVPFLFLTNNSEQTPLDLQRKLKRLGLEHIEEKNFITSAMATAAFLKEQKPQGTVYAIGGAGLTNALYEAGFSISETNPDYVVIGKTKNYNFEMMKKACDLIMKGASFIGTNPDLVDPTEDGLEPACGSLLAPIEQATGKKPYIVGKPNALMMMIAKHTLHVHSEDTVMIGDRMDTDIVAGMEAGMKTCLVLSGVSARDMIEDFPYRPNYIFDNVGQINISEL